MKIVPIRCFKCNAEISGGIFVSGRGWCHLRCYLKEKWRRKRA